VHGGGLQGLVLPHGGQDSGKAVREHRLAGARRAGEQQRMLARGRDLERAARVGLAQHVAQVRMR
jgi:hypothetical protein